MSEINITVKNKVAKGCRKSIVCDNSDYVMKFEFDEEWSGLTTKTARFIWNNQYRDVVFEGDSCAVPVITSAGYFSVGVFAGDLKTTTPAVFSCRKSILSEAGTPSEPTPDVYAEIMRLLNEKPNAENVYTKAETDELLSAKMGSDETYSKTEIDSILDEKVSSDEVYSKSEVDTKFSEIGTVDLTEIEAKIQNDSDEITALKEASEQTEKTVSELENRNIFTDEEKEKLSELENYDDTEIRQQIENKANSDEVYSKTEIDTKLSKIYSKAEVDTMLGDVESVLASVVEVT